jgi:hypothetical protein
MQNNIVTTRVWNYADSTEKNGFKPKYTTAARNNLKAPELFTGMWIYNTDTKRPNRYDGTRWVELPE